MIGFGLIAFEIELTCPNNVQRAEIIKNATQELQIGLNDIKKVAGSATEGKICAEIMEIITSAITSMLKVNSNNTCGILSDAELIKASKEGLTLNHFPLKLLKKLLTNKLLMMIIYSILMTIHRTTLITPISLANQSSATPEFFCSTNSSNTK